MEEFKRITYQDAKPFITDIHYARRLPCIQYAFGMFEDENLIGVCTFGQPASPSLCKGVAGEENRKNVLELNRLVFLPGYNGRNRASKLVSYSLRNLPNELLLYLMQIGVGGIMLDMFTKQQIGILVEQQNQEPINFQKGIADITRQMKQEDNQEVQNTDIFIWLEIKGIKKRCLIN